LKSFTSRFDGNALKCLKKKITPRVV